MGGTTVAGTCCGDVAVAFEAGTSVGVLFVGAVFESQAASSTISRIARAARRKAGLVLIVVGIFQLGLFIWQLRLIQKSLADTKIAAVAAKINADAALEQAKAITLSERAYVSMSHTPSGLTQLPPPDSVYMVEMQIRNEGRTPATITDVVLDVSVLGETESLPAILNYPVNSPEAVPEIFLYADGFFYSERRFPISVDVMNDIQTCKKTLILFGYVDYIDKFGRRHRSGYARRYTPTDRKNNLLIAVKKGYNYDRERQRGEGGDWDTTIEPFHLQALSKT